MRREERQKSIKENRTRIISLEKSKAMKRIKELRVKEEKEQNNKRTVQDQTSKTNDQRTDLSLNLNNPSEDSNPFNELSYSDSNPFLNSPIDADYNDPFITEGKAANGRIPFNDMLFIQG